jgi:periplasmic protein CpxP/Spy
MKTSTKFFAAIAAAGVLALAGAAAFGQPGGGPGPGPGFGPGGGGPGWGMMGGGRGPGGGPGMMGGGGGWGPGGGPGMMGGRGGWGPGGGPGMGNGYDMGAAAAGRLAAFKVQLKITSAQEPAWKAYETVVTQQAQAMEKLRDQFHAQWQNAKPGEAAPDFAAQRQAMFAQRQANWEAQHKAMQDLYAVLTPEQQSLVTGGWGGGRRR